MVNETILEFYRKKWELVSNELLTIDFTGDFVTAYGSELAVLRIEHHYRWIKGVEAGYCKSLEKFFVTFDTKDFSYA